MPPRPATRLTATSTQRSRPVPRRRAAGELSTRDFLAQVLEQVRGRLPADLQALHAEHLGWQIKLWADDPLIHFELWPHRGRGRVELGLHFETRNALRNLCLLDYVADELLFLKEALGQGLEAEPWDKGWTRLYITYPLERLAPDAVPPISAAFATFIETLEPICQEAIEACPTT